MPPVVVEDEIVFMNSLIVWSLHQGRHLLGGEGSLLQGNFTESSDSNHQWGFEKQHFQDLMRSLVQSESFTRAVH
jgi:hypothetical protein